MSLDNLVGTSLEGIELDSATITRLLNAAERNIHDAHVSAVSKENRFCWDQTLLRFNVVADPDCGTSGFLLAT